MCRYCLVSIPSKSGNLVDQGWGVCAVIDVVRSQSLPNQGTWSTRKCRATAHVNLGLNPFQIREPGRPSSWHSIGGRGSRLNPFQIREPGRPGFDFPDAKGYCVSIPSKSGNLVDPAPSNLPRFDIHRGSLNPFQIREPGRPKLQKTVLEGWGGLNPFQIREPGRP